MFLRRSPNPLSAAPGNQKANAGNIGASLPPGALIDLIDLADAVGGAKLPRVFTTSSTICELLPFPTVVDGKNMQSIVAGRFEQDRLTCPLNPACALTVTATNAVSPRCTVSELGSRFS